MQITEEQINNWFMYHSPTPSQQFAYRSLREKARELAFLIVEMVPPGPDQSAAIRKLRECVMTANAGIACSLELGVSSSQGGS